MSKKYSVTIEPSAVTKGRIERIVQVRGLSQRELLTNIVTDAVDTIWQSADFAEEHARHEAALRVGGPPGPAPAAPPAPTVDPFAVLEGSVPPSPAPPSPAPPSIEAP
jgi:hypothetical protein